MLQTCNSETTTNRETEQENLSKTTCMHTHTAKKFSSGSKNEQNIEKLRKNRKNATLPSCNNVTATNREA